MSHRSSPVGLPMVLACLFSLGGLLIPGRGSAQAADDPPASEAPDAGHDHAGHDHAGHDHDAPRPGGDDASAQLSDQEMEAAIAEALERPEAKSLIERFQAAKEQLALSLADMREVHIRYSNEVDQSASAKDRYGALRDQVRMDFAAVMNVALDLMTYGHKPAATFVLTKVQSNVTATVYDADTFEGAAKLLDGGLTYDFLFRGALRSAVVTGEFETARNIFKVLKGEGLEDVDRALELQLDEIQADYATETARYVKDAQDELPRVRLKTSNGDVVVELFLHEAPTAVANFLNLVEDGFYEDAEFYQVVANLLALCGQPSENRSTQFLRDQHDRPDARKPLRGSLVMANLPLEDGTFVPNSATTDFAILTLPAPKIAKSQTVFGRVIEGMEVISTLTLVDPSKPSEQGALKFPPDRIIAAQVLRRPDVLPTPETVPRPGPVDTAE